MRLRDTVAERVGREPGHLDLGSHVASPACTQSTHLSSPAGLLLALCCLPVSAEPMARSITSVALQRLANGVLGMMSYTVAPDVTTSSMSIDNAATANPGLKMTQVGGGFTWSKQHAALPGRQRRVLRYDPTFVASDGTEQRPVPVKWNAVLGHRRHRLGLPAGRRTGRCGRCSTSRSAT